MKRLYCCLVLEFKSIRCSLSATKLQSSTPRNQTPGLCVYQIKLPNTVFLWILSLCVPFDTGSNLLYLHAVHAS